MCHFTLLSSLVVSIIISIHPFSNDQNFPKKNNGYTQCCQMAAIAL